MLIFYCILFILCLNGHEITNKVYVSQFSFAQVDQAMMHFRSLRTNVGLDYSWIAHACISDIESLSFLKMEQLKDRFIKVGVSLTYLHQIMHKNDTDWKNVICLSQIADKYFLEGKTSANIIFISVKYIILRDIDSLITLEDQWIMSGRLFLQCYPKLVTSADEPVNGICELDIVVLPAAIGIRGSSPGSIKWYFIPQ